MPKGIKTRILCKISLLLVFFVLPAIANPVLYEQIIEQSDILAKTVLPVRSITIN